MEIHSIPTALRSYLQDRLPLYMIPATFVLLDTLPLTPNGKVDRRALALKTLPTALDNRTVVAPRNHVEKALAAIWQDLLHLEQVSVTDNFFAVGGHSLLAVRLLNRINQQFGETQLSLAKRGEIVEHLYARDHSTCGPSLQVRGKTTFLLCP
jgi:hypothetical protein